MQLLFHVGFPFPVARIPSRLFLPLQYSTVATTNRPMTRHVSAPNTQRYGGTGRNLHRHISSSAAQRTILRARGIRHRWAVISSSSAAPG